MKKGILPAVAVLCAAAIVVMVVVLTRDSGQQGFTPPPFEPAAQSGQPTVPQDAGYGELDARAFRFSAAGELLALDGEVEVWLTNPAENTVWLKVRILDEAGNILGESGLLRPGEYVRAVRLEQIPKQPTPVSLRIMAYEPETYYSAGSAVLKTTLKVV